MSKINFADEPLITEIAVDGNRSEKSRSKTCMSKRSNKLIVIICSVIAGLAIVLGLGLGIGLSSPEKKNNEDIKCGETVTIGPNIERITSATFKDCKILKRVFFSQETKVTVIEEMAFMDSTLESISIPNTVTVIEKLAFANSKLKEISFFYNKTLARVEEKAFMGCTDLQTVTFPDSLEFLGDEVFANCGKILVNINGSVKEIGKSAFENSGLFSVSIPETLERIGERAFSNTSITGIGTALCKSLNFIGQYAFYSTQIKTFAVPSLLKKVEDYAFAKASNLTELYISSTAELTEIGVGSFSETKLETFACADTLKLIGAGAFENIPSLTDFNHRHCKKLEVIGQKAFKDSKFNSIVIPSSVTTIDLEAFSSTLEDNDDIEEVTFLADTKITHIDPNAFKNRRYKLCILAEEPKKTYIQQILLNNNVVEECL